MNKLVLALALTLIACQLSVATNEEEENDEVQNRFSLKKTLGKISDKVKDNYHATKQTVKKTFKKMFGSGDDDIDEMFQKKRGFTEKIKDGFKSVGEKVRSHWDRVFGKKPKTSIEGIKDDLKEMRDTITRKTNDLLGKRNSDSWSFSKAFNSMKRKFSGFFGNDE